ncbi:antirestriction protein ArdA [Parvularcula flava]|uniref:Antirestriction protein ArdA n=1 Tax=Aquisalinus luteolus TaxID=1566827 RepID=A0A8J3A252_9PROT|nr:antirestriction protein ArdA [Aquisalinus luteolus]NHK27147.1 antirestriction protein ArdA [Aquisalinus luteolus]GGH94542.1 antirestriction protein ArdA [Aquisalinus luteolus]
MTDQLDPIANAAPSAPPRHERPRIYVACLAAYNNGYLHGEWIDATTQEEIMDAVRAMLAGSPVPDAEEWAIHDYEGFEGADIAEYASFKTVCALAGFIEEHGELGAKLYRHFGDDLCEARAAFEDYAGEYASAADFAEQLHDDAGTEIPDSLRYYIDWQALARDMEMSGDILVFETGPDEAHIFWSR